MEKSMRYPKFLQANGTIGFVAPSCGCAIEPYRSAFDNAQKKWDAMGYRMKLGPNCYANDGVGISSTPLSCGPGLAEAVCLVVQLIRRAAADTVGVILIGTVGVVSMNLPCFCHSGTSSLATPCAVYP